MKNANMAPWFIWALSHFASLYWQDVLLDVEDTTLTEKVEFALCIGDAIDIIWTGVESAVSIGVDIDVSAGFVTLEFVSLGRLDILLVLRAKDTAFGKDIGFVIRAGDAIDMIEAGVESAIGDGVNIDVSADFGTLEFKVAWDVAGICWKLLNLDIVIPGIRIDWIVLLGLDVSCKNAKIHVIGL